MLEENFRFRYKENMKFFLEVSDSTIYKAINQFQAYTNNVLKPMNYVYCCYSYFIDFAQFIQIPDKNSIVIVAFNTNILHYYNFDYYGRFDKSVNFCHNC